MKHAVPTIAVAAILAAWSANGQEAIPTGANAGGAPVIDSDQPINVQRFDDRGDEGPLMMVGPCGAVSQPANGAPVKPDNKPHGQVWGGVGTQGYREAGGYVCQPIGQTGSVSIAVDGTRWNTRR